MWCIFERNVFVYALFCVYVVYDTYSLYYITYVIYMIEYDVFVKINKHTLEKI